jgi:hypothetical protein
VKNEKNFKIKNFLARKRAKNRAVGTMGEGDDETRVRENRKAEMFLPS